MHSKMFAKTDYVYMPSEFKSSSKHRGKYKVKEKNGGSGPQDFMEILMSGYEQKIAEMPPEEESENSETDFESADYVVCGKCGERVPTKKQKSQNTHHKNEWIVECPRCSKQLFKKNLTRHLAKCVLKKIYG